MKLAIIQNGDSPQLESTAAMLKVAGYDQVKYCGPELRSALISAGLDTVLSVETMYGLGYDRVNPAITPASLKDMEKCDLFLEIKVRNIDKIRTKWPRLRDKIGWLRVNGSQPEICPKGGDEVNLTCPVITACMWYGTETYRMPWVKLPEAALVDGFKPYATSKAATQSSAEHEHPQNSPAKDHGPVRLGDNGLAYVMWPPYPFPEYGKVERKIMGRGWTLPYSLCHSTRAWGYGSIIDDCHKLGIRCFGNNSPAGQIHHYQVVDIVANALCLVHLKSVDCPGWALYEAMLSGCPVVTGRLLNSRMLAKDLLVHDETCLEFGVPASLEYGRGDMDFPRCLHDIRAALAQLSNPQENLRIGENGRKRLNELMWREDRDGEGFRAFMVRHFG